MNVGSFLFFIIFFIIQSFHLYYQLLLVIDVLVFCEIFRNRTDKSEKFFSNNKVVKVCQQFTSTLGKCNQAIKSKSNQSNQMQSSNQVCSNIYNHYLVTIKLVVLNCNTKFWVNHIIYHFILKK